MGALHYVNAQMEVCTVIKPHNGGLIESGDTGLLIKTCASLLIGRHQLLLPQKKSKAITSSLGLLIEIQSPGAETIKASPSCKTAEAKFLSVC